MPEPPPHAPPPVDAAASPLDDAQLSSEQLLVTEGTTYLLTELFSQTQGHDGEGAASRPADGAAFDDGGGADGQGLGDADDCVVCLTAPAHVALLPCRHYCVCADCLAQLNAQCPVCRGAFGDYLQVHEVTEDGESGRKRGDEDGTSVKVAGPESPRVLDGDGSGAPPPHGACAPTAASFHPSADPALLSKGTPAPAAYYRSSRFGWIGRRLARSWARHSARPEADDGVALTTAGWAE
jgi:hypothetical protein